MTHTHAPRGAGTSPARIYPNKFPGTCTLCGNRVEATKGATFRNASDKWVVQHNAGACPPPKAPSAPPAVPELGYYVRRDGAGIKVVESKRVNDDGTRRRYGLVFTPRPGQRPEWAYVRGAGISVADMRPMSASDAAQLGLSHGHCIACCAPLGGETLSAAISALVGYGETCAKNMGWPYPRGVKAQRTYMEEHGK